jgi:MFS family permease
LSLKLGPEAIAEWRKSWTVVLAAALGVGLMSVPSYSIGVFIGPLSEEFGWKRASIALVLLFNAAAAIVLGAFVGLAVDRMGPRRIALAGSVCVILAFAMMSQTTANIWSWYAIWMFMAITGVLVKPLVWTAAVSSLFQSSRGLALAGTLCGTSLASTVSPIYCSYLITHYGWRVAYLGLVAMLTFLVLPALFFGFTSALDRQRSAAAKGQAKEKVVLSGLSVREGLLSWRFLRLNLAAATMVLVGANTTINFVPIMKSFGHEQMTAASVAGLAGISTIVGRIVGGYLLDRISGNFVAGCSVAMPLVSVGLLLAFPGSVPACAGAALVLGLGLGAELDAVAYLTTRHFGMKSFGVLFGVVGGTLGLATGLGPTILSHIYDVYHSYVPALWGYIPICILGSALFFTLGRYPDFGEKGVPEGGHAPRPVGPGLTEPAPAAPR